MPVSASSTLQKTSHREINSSANTERLHGAEVTLKGDYINAKEQKKCLSSNNRLGFFEEASMKLL